MGARVHHADDDVFTFEAVFPAQAVFFIQQAEELRAVVGIELHCKVFENALYVLVAA